MPPVPSTIVPLRIIRSYSAMFSSSSLAVEGLVDDNKERIADLKQPRTISRGCHRHFPKRQWMSLAPELAVVGDHIIGQIEVDASATALRGAELSQSPFSRLVVGVVIRPRCRRTKPA